MTQPEQPSRTGTLPTMTWSGTLTARSSVHHGGETRGTITMLRWEKVVLADGTLSEVPVVSGNSLRGRLRRIGEELLREVLRYEGQISPAAAHALRGGGSLAKVGSEPLSGSRLHQVRTLLPHVAVFGCAAGGVIIDGVLDVGKVWPHVTETNHITGAASTTEVFSLLQIEEYARQDGTGTSSMAELVDHAGPSQQMQYNLQTFPAGTTFSTWMRLRRPLPLEAAFFADVLAEYTRDGHLGGRIGIGLGQVSADLQADARLPDVDWRQAVADRREDALAVLQLLT